MEALAALKMQITLQNTSDTAIQPILTLKPNIAKEKTIKILNQILPEIKKELKAIKSVNGQINYTEDELYSSSKNY